jgi:hypothetical protein
VSVLLDLDDDVSIGLLDDAPAARAARFVTREDSPSVGDMVGAILLLERHLDDRRAISGPTFAATGTKDVHEPTVRATLARAAGRSPREVSTFSRALQSRRRDLTERRPRLDVWKNRANTRRNREG